MLRVITGAIVSRLMLVLLIVMMATVLGVLLVRSPESDVGQVRIEHSLTLP